MNWGTDCAGEAEEAAGAGKYILFYINTFARCLQGPRAERRGKPQKARATPLSARAEKTCGMERPMPQGDTQCRYFRLEELEVSLSRTSWAPPSTMEVAETRVSLAFSRNSGMVRAPQLHMVERILDRVVAIPSAEEPA